MGALLSTKLTRTLRDAADTFGVSVEVSLKNILVNGQKRGCSGFVRNTSNGSVAYLNTEKSCFEPLAKKNMYRLAANTSDYSSNGLRNGFNRWVSDENLAEVVVAMVKHEKAEYATNKEERV